MSDPTQPPQPVPPERPHMPGYGINPETEGMLDWAWVDERMARARNYWICSTRPDGRPHAVPVWGVWLDGTLYFGTGRGSRKGQNLATNPAVVVHLESGDETVIIEGVVEEVADADLHARFVAATAAKYPPYVPEPEPEASGVRYAVRAQRVMAWLETDYPNTATRWRFSRA